MHLFCHVPYKYYFYRLYAAVNAQTNLGRTPLDLTKNKEIQQLLIAHGGKTKEELDLLEKNI